jgi:Protein of unknown function (DUF3047)
VPKLLPSAISITTGLLTTLVVNHAAWAAGPVAFSQGAGAEPPAPWHFVGLPERYAKPPTLIDLHEIDGKKALRLRNDKSWGSLAHTWTGPAQTIGFQWRLDKALAKASFTAKTTEDAALKVCLSFDMPADRIPSGERTLFKFAQFLSREKLPTATLCYVWAHAEEVGSVHASPTTARVRYMVLDSGAAPLKTWQTHQRNISADFLKAFGTESATVPAVTAIVVGADSDNTQDTSLGYISDIVVQP